MAYKARLKAPSISFSRLVVVVNMKMIQPHRLVALTAVSLCIYKVISIDPDPAPDPVLPTAQELSVLDPERNITCLGAATDIPWILRQQPYDGRSMQELCADPLYGGRNSIPNFRGYCQDGDVFFGPADLLRDNGRFPHSRSKLECRNRCFCNHNLDDPKQQPKEVATTRRTFRDPSDIYLAISVDRESFPQDYGSNDPLLTRIYKYDHGLYSPESESVSILPSNQIQCGGPLPGFPLPSPFNIHDFANNNELCAVQLAGGNPAANAGAYCHRIGYLEKVISFADDMTPRYDWTWSGTMGTDLFLVAAVRFHCWKNCICRSRKATKNYNDPLIPMWIYLLEMAPQDSMPVGSGSTYPLGSSNDARGRPRTSVPGGNVPTAAFAGNLDNSTHIIPWRADILGPVPKHFLSIAVPKPPAGVSPISIVEPKPPAGVSPISIIEPKPPAAVSPPEQKSCGNICVGNNDCGTDCICRVPSFEETYALGVDPVAPPFLCLSIASIFGRSNEKSEASIKIDEGKEKE